VGAGAGGHVRGPGTDVYSLSQQPGATAVGPGVLPIPEALGSLAEGPAGSICLLCFLAQKGSACLLLAGSLLLPSGFHLDSERLLLMLLLTVAPCQNDCRAMTRCAVSSAMLVKIVLEQEVRHIRLCMSILCQAGISTSWRLCCHSHNTTPLKLPQ